jgi:hypothetical protein
VCTAIEARLSTGGCSWITGLELIDERYALPVSCKPPSEGTAKGPCSDDDYVHQRMTITPERTRQSLLPISPGGIGTEQAFLLSLFSGQVSSSALLAFSVGMRLTLMAVNAVLGFAAIFLTLKTVDWRAHAAQSPP